MIRTKKKKRKKKKHVCVRKLFVFVCLLLVLFVAVIFSLLNREFSVVSFILSSQLFCSLTDFMFFSLDQRDNICSFFMYFLAVLLPFSPKLTNHFNLQISYHLILCHFHSSDKLILNRMGWCLQSEAVPRSGRAVDSDS